VSPVDDPHRDLVIQYIACKARTLVVDEKLPQQWSAEYSSGSTPLNLLK
jgi:hypothetical protein